MGKNSGKRVGVATSVSVDYDATPAAFYAHVAGRGSDHNIGKDLYKAGFDFYAGSDFLQPTNKITPTMKTFTIWLGKTDMSLHEDIKII